MPSSTEEQQKSKPMPPPPSSFSFVDMNHMRDSKTLSRIRQHAMKDIGLQRRKPKKRRFIEIALDVAVPAPLPAIGGGAPHTFFKLPIELDELGNMLFANIFNSGEGDNDQRGHREDWFNVALANPATFLQVLANSELHLESLRHPHRLPRETPTSIYYHQQALSAVRREIAGNPVEVSDGLIGTVTGMIIYAEIAGIFECWSTQRKGLVVVIQSRKEGLGSIEGNRHLRATVSWVELRGAFMQDLVSAFALPSSWIEVERQYCSSQATTVRDDEFPSNLPKHGILLDITQRLSNLCRHVSKSLEAPQARILSDADVLLCSNVIAHELLDVRPLEDPSYPVEEAVMMEAWRIAALILLAPIYRHYGAKPWNTRQLVAKQRRLLSTHRINWESFGHLHLWIIVVGTCEAVDEGARAWFVKEVAVAAGECRSGTCHSLPERFEGLPWIKALLDHKLENLTKEVQERAGS